jgi:hypothetical protein
MKDTLYATKDPRSKEFMRELIALCSKHKLAIVPTYQGEVSFHDLMVVIPLGEDTRSFIAATGIEEK